MKEVIGIIGAMESEVNALQKALSSVEKTVPYVVANSTIPRQ